MLTTKLEIKPLLEVVHRFTTKSSVEGKSAHSGDKNPRKDKHFPKGGSANANANGTRLELQFAHFYPMSPVKYI